MMTLPELARDSRGPAPRASGDAATLSTNSLATSDDVELLRRVGRGEAAAYRVFADRHLERTLRFAARLLGDPVEAEDAVQDAFMRVWTDAARFVPDAKPSTWLFRIVHNQCIDRLRKRRPADPDAVDRQSAGDRPSALLSRKQTAEQVARALAAFLTERTRRAGRRQSAPAQRRCSAATRARSACTRLRSLSMRCSRSRRTRRCIRHRRCARAWRRSRFAIRGPLRAPASAGCAT